MRANEAKTEKEAQTQTTLGGEGNPGLGGHTALREATKRRKGREVDGRSAGQAEGGRRRQAVVRHADWLMW